MWLVEPETSMIGCSRDHGNHGGRRAGRLELAKSSQQDFILLSIVTYCVCVDVYRFRYV